MKVLVTGDWHLTDGRRFDSTLNALEQVIAVGIAENVEAWLLTGDFTGTTVPHRQTPRERNAIVDLVRHMASWAPVYMLYGNHDYPSDLDFFQYLHEDITVASQPSFAVLPTASGDDKAVIIMVPYQWREGGNGSIGEGNDKVANETLAFIESVTDELSSIPAIIAGHFNVAGCTTAGGEQLSGREVDFTASQLNRLKVDFIGLGHIHNRQKVADKAYYAGSPDRSNFGESDIKGFMIAEVERGRDPIVTYYDTNAQRFVTFDCRLVEGEWAFDSVPTADKCAGSEVRVRLHFNEGAIGVADFAKDVKQAALGLGAEIVKVEPCPTPRASVRSAKIATMKTEAEKFREWAKQLTSQPEARIVDEAINLLEELSHA